MIEARDGKRVRCRCDWCGVRMPPKPQSQVGRGQHFCCAEHKRLAQHQQRVGG